MPFNVPNMLTITRGVGSLGIWPVLILEEPSWYWAVPVAVVYAFLCATDFLDGFLARRWNQRTPFGERWDPLADKALVMLTIVPLLKYHDLSVLIITVMVFVLSREVIVTIARILLSRVGEALPTIRAARLKTLVQMAGLELMLVGDAFDALLPLFSDYLVRVHVMGEIIFIAGALLGFHSAREYMRTTLAILARRKLPRRI